MTEPSPPRRSSTLRTMVVLTALLVGVVLGAVAVGAVPIGVARASRILAHAAVGVPAVDWPPMDAVIVLKLRLPRVLVAALVGGALAVSGAVMQGVFRNPMADPGVLGVSSGASLGAVTALALGWATTSMLAIPGLAFVGAVGAAFVVYLIATSTGRTSVATLLLSGIAVGNLATALSALVLSLSVSQFEIGRQIALWLMGGLEGRTWWHVGIATPAILGGSLFLLPYARDLNVLTLGEEAALSLGVDVPRVRRDVLVLASAVTAAAVAVSGSIAFVGLVVPHILRLIVGPDYRALLPTSFLGGAILITGADWAARTLIAPQELRLGVLTSLLGGPFFIYLLIAQRRRVGD